MSRILLVDDDATFVERLGRAMEGRGLTVRTAENVGEALVIAAEFHPERAVVDLRMPSGSGLELLQQLVALLPGIEVVVLTGYGSIATAVDALRLGAVGFLQKPVDVDGLLAAFERAAAPPLQPADPTYVPPTLARVEWDHIQRVLSDCAGNVSKAARVLGMHRRTLQRKLSQYPPRQ